MASKVKVHEIPTEGPGASAKDVEGYALTPPSGYTVFGKVITTVSGNSNLVRILVLWSEP